MNNHHDPIDMPALAARILGFQDGTRIPVEGTLPAHPTRRADGRAPNPAVADAALATAIEDGAETYPGAKVPEVAKEGSVYWTHGRYCDSYYEDRLDGTRWLHTSQGIAQRDMTCPRTSITLTPSEVAAIVASWSAFTPTPIPAAKVPATLAEDLTAGVAESTLGVCGGSDCDSPIDCPHGAPVNPLPTPHQCITENIGRMVREIVTNRYNDARVSERDLSVTMRVFHIGTKAAEVCDIRFSEELESAMLLDIGRVLCGTRCELSGDKLTASTVREILTRIADSALSHVADDDTGEIESTIRDVYEGRIPDRNDDDSNARTEATTPRDAGHGRPAPLSEEPERFDECTGPCGGAS